MKIGIFFESLVNSGGGISVSQTRLNFLTKSLENEHSYICFVTNKHSYEFLKKKNFDNLIYFKINFFLKLLFFLHSINFTKKIFSIVGILNPLEKYLVKYKIDLLYFISPSPFVKFCNFTPFVYSIWEMQHRSIPYFPEYRDIKGSQSDFLSREESYKYASDLAFKILVDTEKTKEDIKKAYNVDRKKLFEIQPFVPNLPAYYEKIRDKYNFDKIFKELKLPQKKILFYPAQFWPHKNHIYLVNSLESLVNNNNEEFILVFTGYDKGNKKYILNQVKNKKLENYIYFFDYLSSEQIISLYKNSFALTMTTLVGRSSLPLREAFYFELPIFYSGNILDDKYSSFVNELDLKDFDSLKNHLLKKDYSINKDKIIKAKDFYNTTCNDQVIIDSYKNIINEFKFNQEFWKKIN